MQKVNNTSRESGGKKVMQEPMFEIAGGQYTLTEMLEANSEDGFVCEWLRKAQVGDVLKEGEPVKRVS